MFDSPFNKDDINLIGNSEQTNLTENLLNIDYYKKLITIYATKVFPTSSIMPISTFNKINISFIQKTQNDNIGTNIIIHMPKHFDNLFSQLITNVYLYFANLQFYKNYNSLPKLKNGIYVKRNENKNRKYQLIDINDSTVVLIEKRKDKLNDHCKPAKYTIPQKFFERDFILVNRPLKKQSLNNYIKLFSHLNDLDQDKDLIPTNFSSVIVFIGSKKILEGFREFKIFDANLYNSIPCHYINREGEEYDTLGISPLCYFAASYKIAFEQIIIKKIKVDHIILFNDGFDEIQQIINDQSTYKFKLVGISDDFELQPLKLVKCWKWYKEEIDLIGKI